MASYPKEYIEQRKKQLASELEDALKIYKIPTYMHKPLFTYIVDRKPVGSFLTAVFENDLREAAVRADGFNSMALVEYVKLLNMGAPATCWGSKEKVKDWLKGWEDNDS